MDYKIRNEQIEKEIDIIKNEIEEKKMEIGNFKEKRKKLEEENSKKKQNLKHACTKIKIIQEQISVLSSQIEEFKKYQKNKNNKECCNMYSICNIINNKNYYLNNVINFNDNSNLNTLRK